jgi:hypothetical protein
LFGGIVGLVYYLNRKKLYYWGQKIC